MKKFLKLYIRFVQKILITILLTILYFLIFSITKLIVLVFPNKHLKRKKQTDTYWLEAEDYGSNFESSLEQS